MAQCVAIVSGSVVESIAEPCTGFVLLNPAEFATLTSNPLLLSAENGFILSAAVVGVWASAFAIRALVRVLNAADGGQPSE